MIKFELRMFDHPVDLGLGRWVSFRLLQPFLPDLGKKLSAFGLHQNTEVIIAFPFRVPDQLVLFITNGSLCVATCLMNQVSMFTMTGSFPIQNGQQTFTVNLGSFSSGNVHQRRGNVAIHCDCICHGRLDLSRPAYKTESLGSVVIDRPFTIR